MSVTVRVPTTLRTLTGGESEVAVDGATVGDVLTALDAAHPGFKDKLFDDEGNLRRFVNVFVADDDVRFVVAGAAVVVLIGAVLFSKRSDATVGAEAPAKESATA